MTVITSMAAIITAYIRATRFKIAIIYRIYQGHKVQDLPNPLKEGLLSGRHQKREGVFLNFEGITRAFASF